MLEVVVLKMGWFVEAVGGGATDGRVRSRKLVGAGEEQGWRNLLVDGAEDGPGKDTNCKRTDNDA